MNLVAYDEITDKVDKTKTWLDGKTGNIFSRELVFRKYYTFIKRYNPKTKNTTIYIAMLDNKSDAKIAYDTRKDTYNRICLKTKLILREFSLNNVNKEINIHLNHVESTNDGDVYEIIV